MFGGWHFTVIELKYIIKINIKLLRSLSPMFVTYLVYTAILFENVYLACGFPWKKALKFVPFCKKWNDLLSTISVLCECLLNHLIKSIYKWSNAYHWTKRNLYPAIFTNYIFVTRGNIFLLFDFLVALRLFY